jgi:hypothetical protein
LVAGAGTRRTVGSKAGSRSEDGALRLGAGDSLSPRGRRDKQRAVAVGDLRVALPAATLLSAPRPDTYFSVRGRGSARRQAGRHKRHPPVTTTQPDKSSVVCFSLVFGSLDHRPLHGLITRGRGAFLARKIIKTPDMSVRI